ncbi:MAG: DUF1501 domain-containing protein [Saprospiraceae bacterium]|nr:DUF1501 domain-containing protein [Saprospiraceae bacterium]
MKRRDFLKYTAHLSSAPILLNNIPVSAFSTVNMLPLLNCAGVDDRILVVIFLKGGNDGINTIVPIDQYPDYVSNRPNIALPDAGTGAYIDLDTTLPIVDQVGLHPVMTSFKSMYDSGLAGLIQAVGYPDSNLSHFKSTDLWLTGGDGTTPYNNLSSGWLGRFLELMYQGLAGNPTEANPDPLGIQLGDTKPSPMFFNDGGKYLAANMSQQNPSELFDTVQGIGTPPQSTFPNSEYGNELAFIMAVENSINVYAQRIANVFNSGTNSTVTYPNTSLGNQLKTIAKLISGGSMTKAYLSHTGGFDTHSGQVQGGSPYLGAHANLLTNVFDSVKAFHDDLTMLGHDQRVITVTFSEFGRKVIQNGSLGTDHGNFAPMFFFGQGIEPGVIGTNVNLTSQTGDGRLTSDQMQFDYRQVFKTLLQDWLGANNSVVDATFLTSYSSLPDLVNTANTVDPSCYMGTYITQSLGRARLFLEGFYDPLAGVMRTDLAEKGLIPLSQPYNVAPFNYTGTEAVTEVSDDIVDWVLMELRDGSDINTVIGRRAGFLRRDGQVVGLNGGFGIAFDDVLPGTFYIAVYHRSHIAVVSNVPLDLSDVTNTHDFTLAATQALGTGQLKEMNGKYALFAGDYDGSGVNDDLDYDKWKTESSSVNGYETSDADGNGVVNNRDFNLWKRNLNQAGHPVVQQ